MGSSGVYVFEDGHWGSEPAGDTWLGVEIYDSDIATVTFQPVGSSKGLFFLDFQPRDHFDDADESSDVDAEAESRALAEWARR